MIYVNLYFKKILGMGEAVEKETNFEDFNAIIYIISYFDFDINFILEQRKGSPLVKSFSF